MAAPITGGTTPALWLKADAITGKVDGNTVAFGDWPNSSGGTALGGGSGGVYKTNILNSLPVVRLNGSSQYYTWPVGFADDYFTIIAVVRQNTGQDYAAICAEYSGTSSGYFSCLYGPAATGRKLGIGRTGQADQECNLTTTPATWDLPTYRSPGKSNNVTGAPANTIESYVRRNGVWATTYIGLGSYSVNGASCIGASKNGTADFLNGDIAELLIYTGYLSFQELQNVEQYLATKYNLTVTDVGNYTEDSWDGWTASNSGTPVLTPGSATDPDSLQINSPAYIYKNSTYYVAYVAYGPTASPYNSICMATGSSPTSLTKQGRIIDKGGTSFSSQYVSGCRLYLDDNGDVYCLFFGSNNAGFEAEPSSIGIAKCLAANDPAVAGNWVKTNDPILVPGTAGAWDDQTLYRPFLFKTATQWYLFYNAKKSGGGTESIGYATCPLASDIRVAANWTKYSGNPVLEHSASGWDSVRIGDPILWQPQAGTDYWVMNFYGSDGTVVGTGLSHSTEASDFSSWTRYAGNFLRVVNTPDSMRWTSNPVTTGSVTQWGGYYDNGQNGGDAIYYATLDYALPPTNTVAPAVTGTAQVGQTLTTTNGTWTNTPTSYTYLWKHGDDSAAGGTATNSTYVPVAGDIGFGMKCLVTATNGAGDGSPATSNTTSAVLPAVPVNSVAPVVSGTAQVGQTLSSTTGTWSNTPTSYAYQWQRSNGGAYANISAATSSTYVPVTGDIGYTIRCSVIASNAGGPGTVANSNATSAVIAIAPVAEFTGTPLTGAPPLSVTFTYSGTGGTPVSYSWEKNLDGGGWVAFAGTPTAQNPTESFAEGTSSVRVTATNTGGSNTRTRTNYITATVPASGGSDNGTFGIGIGIGL